MTIISPSRRRRNTARIQALAGAAPASCADHNHRL